jgi:hypothetical protein
MGFAVAYPIVVIAILILTEQVQRYLYDDLVSGLWWRASVGGVPLAALIVYAPLQLDTMFTELTQFGWVLVHAAAWSFIMWQPIRFLTPHAAAVGILCAMLLGPLVTMAVESFKTKFGRGPVAEIASDHICRGCW